jgi:hypothetical protein
MLQPRRRERFWKSFATLRFPGPKNLRESDPIFVGHGFKPCHYACGLNPALAAGLFNFESSRIL